MKKIFLITLLCLTPSILYAQDWSFDPDQYNGYEDTEDTRELRHDPYDNEWSYEEPDSTLQYNPFEDEWDYKEEGEGWQYNPFEDRWE